MKSEPDSSHQSSVIAAIFALIALAAASCASREPATNPLLQAQAADAGTPSAPEAAASKQPPAAPALQASSDRKGASGPGRKHGGERSSPADGDCTDGPANCTDFVFRVFMPGNNYDDANDSYSTAVDRIKNGIDSHAMGAFGGTCPGSTNEKKPRMLSADDVFQNGPPPPRPAGSFPINNKDKDHPHSCFEKREGWKACDVKPDDRAGPYFRSDDGIMFFAKDDPSKQLHVFVPCAVAKKDNSLQIEIKDYQTATDPRLMDDVIYFCGTHRYDSQAKRMEYKATQLPDGPQACP